MKTFGGTPKITTSILAKTIYASALTALITCSTAHAAIKMLESDQSASHHPYWPESETVECSDEKSVFNIFSTITSNQLSLFSFGKDALDSTNLKSSNNSFLTSSNTLKSQAPQPESIALAALALLSLSLLIRKAVSPR